MINGDAPYDGTPFTIGGREWIVPALSLGQVIKLAPKIKALVVNQANGTPDSGYENAVDIVLAAFKRNYPELTREKLLDEIVDLRNFGPILQAIMGQSGFSTVSSEGKAPAGSP